MIKMNIVFLGSRYINSSSMSLAPVLAHMGIGKMGFIDSGNLAFKYVQTNDYEMDEYYKYKKKSIPLSFLFDVMPPEFEIFDTIFVEQHGFKFHNDTDLKTIYYHRDIPSIMFMEDMDIFLYRFKTMERIISRDYPEVWGNGIHKQRFLNAVNMKGFEHDFDKLFKGINWIGWLKTWEYYWQFPSQVEYYKYVKKIIDFARKYKLIEYHEHGINYIDYRQILQQSEAVLIIPGNEAYVTRKIYEAAASRTMIVLWVQNDEAVQVFADLGLIDGVNCIMFRTKKELFEISHNFKNLNVELIVKLAYKWVKNNHTWENRARELIEILKFLQN